MTDTEILNEIEQRINVKALKCRTASVLLSSREGRDGGVLYRYSGGAWKPSLREAIIAHVGRWERGAYRDTRIQKGYYAAEAEGPMAALTEDQQ